MPRERTLSHGFFTNHLLASCDPVVRLLFQGIWTIADFDGCFQWDPPALAMRLLPRDQFDPVEAMALLERHGFLRSYLSSGVMFGYVVNWHKYQDPHPAEKAVHPRPKEDQDFMVRVKAPNYRKPYDLGFGRLDILKGVYPYQQVARRLLESCQSVSSNAYLSNLSNLSNPSFPTKEIKEPPAEAGILPLQPSASALSPSGEEKKKERKPRRVQTTALKDGSVKSFEAAWETVPKTFRKWDAQLREYVDEPIPKGSRLEAERNFQAIVDSKVATPQELYYAFYAYITEGEGPAKGFYQALSTFCGPRKATYLQWIGRGHELALEAQ